MATSDVNKESTSVDDVILHQESQESCESVNVSEVQVNESVSTSVSTIKSDIDNKGENSDSCTDNTGRDTNKAKTERLIPLHFPKNVKDTSKPVNAKPSPKKCKKYGNQSVVWEPVLIKTEKDGKVTVTTGMKKTTESEPYVPKKSAIYGSQSKSLNVSAQDAFNSPQSKMPVNTTLHTNVSSIRTSIEPLTKRYPHYLNPSVNKNLGRAIAEKKASIMKEISKVMKEAGTSKGLDMPVVGDKLKPGNTSITNTQHTILKGNKRNSSKTVRSDCNPNEDSDIKEDGKNLVSHNSNNDKSNMYLCGTVEENSLSSDTDSLQQLINSEPVKCITATPSAAKGREPIVPTAQEGTLAIPSAHIPSSVALLPCETSAVPCVLSNSSDNRSGTKKTKTKHFNNDRNNKKSNTVSQVKSKSQAKKTVSKRLQSDIPVKNKLNSRGSDLTIVSTSTSELERDLYTLSPPVKKQRLSAKTPPTAKLKSSEEKVQHNITKKKLTSVKSIHAPVSKDSSVVPTTPTVGKQIKKRLRINTVNKIGVPLVKNVRSATLKASVFKTKVIQSGAGRSKQVNSQKRSRNSLNDSTDILPLKSSPVLTPHEVISRITRAKTLKKNSTGIVKASGIMRKKGKQQTTKKQEELIISKKTDNKNLVEHKADNDKIVSPGIKEKEKVVTEKEGQLKMDEVSLVAQCSVNDIRNKRLEKIGGLCEEMPPTDPYIAFAPSECDILSKFIRETTEDIEFLTKDIEELAENTCVSEYIDCETQTEAEVFLENEVDVNFEIPASTGHVLCRLCAGSFQRDALIALYGRVGSEKNLLPMINAVLPRSLKIIELDGLPQQVCLWCAEKLKSCYVILKSFMNADKTLRSVLYEQDSLHQVHNTNVQGSNNKNQSSPHSETPDLGEKMFTSPSQERHDTSASDFASKQEKKQVNSDKHSNETIASVEESVDNSESMKCIDLSRLDPEFHSGFEVEWCLDEEALRSCMISVPSDSKELSSEVSLSSKHDNCINIDINEGFGSSDHFAKTTYSSRVSLTKESSLDDNRDNLEDIFESYELEGKPVSVTQAVQVPIEESDSSVLSLANKCLKGHLQFSNEVEHIDDFPQETDEMECLQCQILFSSKSEALLHRVIHHRETVTTISPKENSLEITCEGSNQEEDVHKSQNLPQGKNQDEQLECDECELTFGNQYSLFIHKSVIHDNVDDIGSVNSKSETPSADNVQSYVKQDVQLTDTYFGNEDSKRKLIDSNETQNKSFQIDEGNNCNLQFNSSHLFSKHTEPYISVVYGDLATLDESRVIYSCDTCKATFSKEELLIEHMKCHCTHIIFSCQSCNKTFNNEVSLTNHVKEHGVKEYICVICNNSFLTHKALKIHSEIHTSELTCEICGLVLTSIKHLLRHKSAHSKRLPFMCEICDKRFPNEETFIVHKSIHINVGYTCSVCDKTFLFKCAFLQHTIMHSKKLYQCFLCLRKLSRKSLLSKHLALHRIIKKYSCVLCKMYFSSESELLMHRYQNHSSREIYNAENKHISMREPIPYNQCNVCSKVLHSKEKLRNHQAVHVATYPYNCTDCYRSYASLTQLNKHACHKKHSLPYQCTRCGKAFHRKNMFMKHKIIHEDKWKYICQYCGKAFQQRKSLIGHLQTHPKKNFHCPHCSLPFTTKDSKLHHVFSCQKKDSSAS